MQHIAIDLGGSQSQICVRDKAGNVLEERRCRTGVLEGYLAKQPPSRVIVETSAEAFAISEAAVRCGHEVRVVPATLVRTLGVGQRRIKTDRRDAQVLSEVSSRIDLPSVHVPSAENREVKSRCGMRSALVRTRTMLINNVRGWLRGRLIRVRTGGAESFAVRVREKLGDDLPGHLERQLRVLDLLNEEIKAATKELKELAQQHEICSRLMTVPGVGPVTALSFVAAIDDVDRFKNAHQLESYLGLTPGESSSAERKRITSITKAGSATARWTLVQAAWTHWRIRSTDATSQWADQVAARRGRVIAAVALARKLAGILYALWRDGTTYDPQFQRTETPPPRVYRLRSS